MFRHTLSLGFFALLPLTAPAEPSLNQILPLAPVTPAKILQTFPSPVSRVFTLPRDEAKDIQQKLTEILTPGGTDGAATTSSSTASRRQTTTRASAKEAASTVELNIPAGSESFVSGKVTITADIRTNRLHVTASPDAMPKIARLIKLAQATQ